jgi:light-harvesting complex I chlorophyll a/b binding protein 1
MKLAIIASVVTSAAAFAPSKSSSSSKVAALNAVPYNRPSEALPFSKQGCPATLDGSLPGDAGFDPVGFSTTPIVNLFDSKSGGADTMSDLYWLREAEITHGRIAQLAVLGFIYPAVFGTFPGNEWTGVDAYSYVNPLEALDHVPGFAITQIVAAMSWVELKRVSLIKEQGASRIPGDLLLGQGPGERVNPFGLNYTPEEFYEKQVQEIKHCRLAMLGAFGLYCQAANSGLDIKSQIGAALTYPEWYQKAGYFLPEGI